MIRVLAALAALVSVAAFDVALAEGDLAKGENVFKKCRACHAVGEDAKNKVGPQLNDLFGRTAGTVEKFKYSKALIAKGEEGLVWSEETLTEFLKAPKKYVPKTKMAFGGVRKDGDLADLIAYLKQFSADAGDGTQSAAPSGGETETAKADASDEEAAPQAAPEFTEAILNDPEIIAAGGEIWSSQCRHCHGANAYPGKAPKLKPRRYKPQFVFDRVTDGFRKMPAWKEVYTQDERVAIVAYVKSRKFSP